MAEPSLKRQRVSEDILSKSSSIGILVPHDTNQEKISQIHASVDNLEAKYYKAKRLLECANLTHELSIKEKASEIADLVKEVNDTKARAIHHKKRADEAVKTLEVMKAMHNEVANDLRDKVEEGRKSIASMEEELASHKRQYKKLESVKDGEIQELTFENQRLHSANTAYQQLINEKEDTLQAALQRESELKSLITQLESSQLEVPSTSNDDLTQDYHNLSKRYAQLEKDNAKTHSELTHYKNMSQNIEYLREERNSLKAQLSQINEINQAKFMLEVENANLVAERDAWTRYLDSKLEYNQQSPGSVVYQLSQQADEAKFLSSQVQQLNMQIVNQSKLLGAYEDHVDELKQEALQTERMKALHAAEIKLMSKNEESLKRHISILQGQLQLYDNEEKLNMESTYDSNKALRIAQLEMLLRELEIQLKTQVGEIAKQMNNDISAINQQHGIYEELTSGVKVVELIKQLKEQYEQAMQELKQAREQAKEQFMTQEQTIVAPLVEPITNTTGNESPQHRILSLLTGPNVTDYAIRKETLEKLRQENQDLLRRIQGESTDDMVTVPQTTLSNLEDQAKALQAKLEAKDKRIDRLHTIWEEKVKQTSAHIRNLLGYNVHFREDDIVALDSIFVDPAELTFLVNSSEILRIVGSKRDQYLAQLNEIYEMYVVNDKNIPAFLNAANQDLYIQSKAMEYSEDEGQVHKDIADEDYATSQEEEDEMEFIEQPQDTEEVEYYDEDSEVLIFEDTQQDMVYRDNDELEETEQSEESQVYQEDQVYQVGEVYEDQEEVYEDSEEEEELSDEEGYDDVDNDDPVDYQVVNTEHGQVLVLDSDDDE